MIISSTMLISEMLLLYICTTIPVAWATVDINLAELQYLSNHLTPAECKRLIAALHDNGYELNIRLTESGFLLPENLSCFEALMHWNSSPVEGHEATHDVVTRRLRQLGRYDLAKWLSRTIFHQLAEKINHLLLTPSNVASDIAK